MRMNPTAARLATAPPNPTPNYLGQINLNTGTVTPVNTAGQPFTPHALVFVAHTD